MDINEKKSGIFRWLVSINEYISVCILNVVSLIYGLADLLVHIGLGVIELRGLLGLGGGLHSTVCKPPVIVLVGLLITAHVHMYFACLLSMCI